MLKRSPAWFVRKLHHSIDVRLDRAKIRCEDYLGLRKPSKVDISIIPWSPLAAVPGNPLYLPWGAHWETDDLNAAIATDIRAHRFRIFTEHPVEVMIEDAQRSAKIADLARELPADLVLDYRPIDWHSDFHCGYRWGPSQFFQDVRVAPVPGADIKVPRELSRFQHVGALAHGTPGESAVEFMLQVIDWIVANPYGRGVNWACSMDVALRAVNWIWGLRLFEPQIARYPKIQSLIGNSLRDHGRHIYENLEYWRESTSNHYLADIAGLIYIGAALPGLPESDLWLAFGVQELVSEMQREVLPDGACHEASTHYHRLVAELFVSCAALVERIPAARKGRLKSVDRSLHKVKPLLLPIESSGYVLDGELQVLPAWFYSRLASMAEFSLAMRKPNGFVPQIGDNDSARVHKLMPTLARETRNHDHLFACVGELLNREDLRAAGAGAAFEGKLVCGGAKVVAEELSGETRTSRFSRVFADTGIVVIAAGKAWLGVTCGPSGQGGRGGHGHNDKNSFELNVNGLDIIVDGGCPAYTQAPQLRNRFRSTAMHNTIHVQGVEQNRWAKGLGGLFRLVERANPTLVVDDDGVVEGSHVGYGSPHRRKFDLQRGKLVIEDFFGDERERYLTFNCDPDVAIEITETGSQYVVCSLQHVQGLAIQLKVEGVISPFVDCGAYGLGYMRPVENLRLLFRLNGYLARSEFSWSVADVE